MSAEKDNQQNHFINIKNKYIIMKVGDEYCSPDYDHPTIKAFNKLYGKKKDHEKIVLCLIHSPDSKISSYKYQKGLFNLKIPKSEFIFKMPNSPKHTFVIVDVKNPGVIVAKSEKKRIVNILNLQTIINKIVKLETSVDKNKMIEFSGLPHFVFGKI